MIFDDIENLSKYGIDKEICDFILNLDLNINKGRHEINEKSYINIDSYETKSEIKLEAHKKYIDIQLVLEGRERIYTTNIHGLEILEEYDNKRDIEFYKTPNRPLNLTFLEKGKFILLDTNDAHSPCINYEENKSENVKKAVVKILKEEK